MAEQIKNKRKFFRVDDQVEMYVSSLESIDAVITDAHFGEFFPSEDALFFRMIEDTQFITREIMHRLTEVEKRDPLIASLLRRLNEKTTITLSGVLSSKLRPHQAINLSLGGMGFISDEALNEGDCLAIKLILRPALLVLTLKGKVLNSSINEHDNSCRACVAFYDMAEEDKDMLSYHINEIQRRNIQAFKAQTSLLEPI